MIGEWPKGTSNILEGLRLALGLGEEKGGSRMGAGGRLVVLRTMHAFISATLRSSEDQDPEGIFDGWIPSEKSGSLGKGKGKWRAVGRAETAEEMLEEGYLVGMGNWGIADESISDWELSRLSSGLGGDDTPEADILAVSLVCHRSDRC